MKQPKRSQFLVNLATHVRVFSWESWEIISSHQKCSIEKAVLKKFAIFTGQHLRRSLFLIKLPGLLTLLWRRSLSYKNQSTDFQGKPMDWFLYDSDRAATLLKKRLGRPAVLLKSYSSKGVFLWILGNI